MKVEDTGVTGVVVITVLCLLVAQGLKAAEVVGHKWLPLISGGLGGILGVLGMLYMPEFPAGDWITALAVGVVSGLAATGSHQLMKQLVPEDML